MMDHIGVFGPGGSLRLAPALQSLYAATSVKQICLQQTPKAQLSTKRNEARTMHIPHLRKDKGELLYRLTAHGKKMHNKNSTRYVESSCTEIHLHA